MKKNKNYQDKPVKRGTPSSFYRQTHPFPTTLQSFGHPQFVTNKGLELKGADGITREHMRRTKTIPKDPWTGDSVYYRSKDILFYRSPRGKNSTVPKVGEKLTFLDLNFGRQYNARIMRKQGDLYGRGNTGIVVVGNITQAASFLSMEDYIAKAKSSLQPKIRQFL